uniref:NUC domain-containing protein n=1 Tax=Steinernema glaseri TaxID=37863 RepID=A0A1I8AQ92_9BILA
NVELFNFFANLMELPSTPANNGTKGVLDALLVNPPKLEDTGMMTTVPSCAEEDTSFTCGSKCPSVEFPRSSTTTCNRLPNLQVPSSSSTEALCAVELCGTSLIFNRRLRKAKMAQSVLEAPSDLGSLVDCRIAVTSISKGMLGNCTGQSAPSVSLFPKDGRNQYIVDGQFELDSKFVNGIWKELLNQIRSYRTHYKRLIMYSGPVYDLDAKGKVLSDDEILKRYFDLGALPSQSLLGLRRLHPPTSSWFYSAAPLDSGARRASPVPTLLPLRCCPSSFPQFQRITTAWSSSPTPTHIFVVLFLCSDGLWSSSGVSCANPSASQVLAFLLPTIPEDYNCLPPEEYLFQHTSRVRDIELATGLEFFSDRADFDSATALRLRTELPEKLWRV